MKAAILYWIYEEAIDVIASGGSTDRHETAYQAVRAIETTNLPVRTERTSSPKRKSFPRELRDYLISYAQDSRHARYAGKLAAFVQANLLVGLRPVEWFGVEFIEPARGVKAPITLKVENAKTSYGRGNGTIRKIELHNISADDLARLLHFQSLVNSFERQFPPGTSRNELVDKFFKPLQGLLRHVTESTGKGPYSLYSTRHQAIANAKGSGLEDIEVTAMFGHRSTKTAKNHYGKKSEGWQTTTFRPAQETVNSARAFTRSIVRNHEEAAPGPAIRKQAEGMIERTSEHA
jgi:hypothetical protein